MYIYDWKYVCCLNVCVFWYISICTYFWLNCHERFSWFIMDWPLFPLMSTHFSIVPYFHFLLYFFTKLIFICDKCPRAISAPENKGHVFWQCVVLVLLSFIQFYLMYFCILNFWNGPPLSWYFEHSWIPTCPCALHFNWKYLIQSRQWYYLNQI